MACWLSSCWSEEVVRMVSCWKNTDGDGGSSASHSGAASTSAAMLLAIQS